MSTLDQLRSICNHSCAPSVALTAAQIKRSEDQENYEFIRDVIGMLGGEDLRVCRLVRDNVVQIVEPRTNTHGLRPTIRNFAGKTVEAGAQVVWIDHKRGTSFPIHGLSHLVEVIAERRALRGLERAA